MNKQAFLKTYKKINDLKEKADSQGNNNPTEPKLYRSEQDERLIKEMHFAKFQKNLERAQQSASFKALIEKEEWDEKDMQKLLASLR